VHPVHVAQKLFVDVLRPMRGEKLFCPQVHEDVRQAQLQQDASVQYNEGVVEVHLRDLRTAFTGASSTAFLTDRALTAFEKCPSG